MVTINVWLRGKNSSQVVTVSRVPVPGERIQFNTGQHYEEVIVHCVIHFCAEEGRTAAADVEAHRSIDATTPERERFC